MQIYNDKNIKIRKRPKDIEDNAKHASADDELESIKVSFLDKNKKFLLSPHQFPEEFGIGELNHKPILFFQ